MRPTWGSVRPAWDVGRPTWGTLMIRMQNSVLRPPFSFSWPIERRCLLFYMKHAGSLKKNSPEDSAIHRAYVEDKRDKYIDAGVVFLAYVLRI